MNYTIQGSIMKTKYFSFSFHLQCHYVCIDKFNPFKLLFNSTNLKNVYKVKRQNDWIFSDQLYLNKITLSKMSIKVLGNYSDTKKTICPWQFSRMSC